MAPTYRTRKRYYIEEPALSIYRCFVINSSGPVAAADLASVDSVLSPSPHATLTSAPDGPRSLLTGLGPLHLAFPMSSLSCSQESAF